MFDIYSCIFTFYDDFGWDLLSMRENGTYRNPNCEFYSLSEFHSFIRYEIMMSATCRDPVEIIFRIYDL